MSDPKSPATPNFPATGPVSPNPHKNPSPAGGEVQVPQK
jgi:hypothetical protein